MLMDFFYLDFDTAEKEFDAVQKADPYRMEEVDIYSNMLYVMNKKAKLGKLAHEYAEIDRNRAEVCCLIGTSQKPEADMFRGLQLSKARDCVLIDPILTTLGNYYSSKADHTKAILYFKRSLMLNREYLPAWTLMGHEFVELKNSHAAIEAYRKAIGWCRRKYSSRFDTEILMIRYQCKRLSSVVWTWSSL